MCDGVILGMKIALIGTCRIHDPLQAFWSDESYIILNEERPSFTHNSSEIIQRLEHYDENYHYPVALQDFQVKTNSTKLKEDSKISDVDVFVVEISSMKLIQFNTHQLQWNMLSFIDLQGVFYTCHTIFLTVTGRFGVIFTFDASFELPWFRSTR